MSAPTHSQKFCACRRYRQIRITARPNTGDHLASLCLPAAGAFAEDAILTCNIVGEYERRDGGTHVDHYRRMQFRRDYWRTMFDVSDAQYRAVLMNPYEPAREWQANVLRLISIGDTHKFYLDNCEERLQDVTTESTIELWSEVSSGGHIEARYMTVGQFMEGGCGDLGFNGFRRAFATDRAFALWNRENGDAIESIARYNASKNPVLRECMLSEGDGASVSIPRHETSHACDNHDYWFDEDSGSTSAYRLKVSNGVLTVEHEISFLYEGKSGNRDAVFAAVATQKECVERFHASKGLRLKLTFRTDPALHEFYKRADSWVTLHDSRGGTNSYHWAVLKERGNSVSDKQLCGTMAYEIGHTLGLGDLYPNPGYCPDRKVGDDPQNLMYSGNQDIDTARLSDDQLRAITAPLCNR